MGRRRQVLAVALAIAGLAGLVVTWAVTTPPGGYPDEPDHYVRALAVAGGSLGGDPDPRLAAADPAAATVKRCCEPPNALAERWIFRGARVVTIPARLALERVDCAGESHLLNVDCALDTTGDTLEHVTNMGTVEPATYLVPGLTARLASDPVTALRLGRVANGVLGTAFVALGVLALVADRRRPLALVAVLVATTPMVLYVVSSLSPSSLEVASAFAFMALLLRVTRPDRDTARHDLVALATAGAVLAVSRSLGPVWIAEAAVLAVVLRGRTTVKERVLAAIPRPLIVVVAMAVASTVVWELFAQPHVELDVGFAIERIGPSLQDLQHRVWHELIGVFGSLTVPLSSTAYAAWGLLFAAIVFVALRDGSTRQRVALVVAIGVALLTAVGLSVAVMNQNGFGLQGRHVLPVVVFVPLLAAEVLAADSRRMSPTTERALAGAGAAVVAAVQLHAVLRAGDRFGWRTDALPTAWRPPGPAALWVTVAAVSCAAIVLGALAAAREPFDPVGLGDDAGAGRRFEPLR